MVTQDSTQTGLLNLIAELHARENEQSQALEETQQNIKAVQRALELLQERYGLPATQRPAVDEYQRMTLPQALVKFARLHGGKVKVTDAKRQFLAAGVMGGQARTAYQRITACLIRRDDLFEHSGPGEYRLLPEQSAYLKVG